MKKNSYYVHVIYINYGNDKFLVIGCYASTLEAFYIFLLDPLAVNSCLTTVNIIQWHVYRLKDVSAIYCANQ